MNWIDFQNTIYKNGVINIFCDASIRKLNSGEMIGSPGAIYLAKDPNQKSKFYTLKYLDILRHSTNNHSEIYAIYMAYQLAKILHYEVGGNPRINIFSDSQISVYGLRSWIFSWVKGSQRDNLVSSTGKDVANQEIYKLIVRDMIESQIPIYLYHTKGHVNINNKKELNNAKRVFDRSNSTNASIDIIYEVSYGNDLVDNVTRDQIDIFLCNNDITTNTNNPIKPYYISISDINMNDYKEVLGGI